jgi:hypothetical protein
VKPRAPTFDEVMLIVTCWLIFVWLLVSAST